MFQLPIIPELMFRMNNSKLIRILYKRIKVNGKPMDNEDVEQYVRSVQTHRGASGINYYRAAFRDALRRRLSPRKKVQCPTLVLWGTKDFALHINLTKYLHEYVKKGLFKIKYLKNAGHFIQQEKPKAVAEEIINFL